MIDGGMVLSGACIGAWGSDGSTGGQKKTGLYAGWGGLSISLWLLERVVVVTAVSKQDCPTIQIFPCNADIHVGAGLECDVGSLHALCTQGRMPGILRHQLDSFSNCL